MAKNSDDVIIKRSAAKKKQADEKKIIDGPIPLHEENDNKYIYAKIFAALLAMFALLLLFSLISYTPKDELNAKVTMSELLSIFSSDSMIRIKADTTYNWLGLLGAVIANITINWTIGYLIIFLPIFLFFWAFNIYKSLEIPEKLIRSTSIYLIFSVLLASLIGSFRGWFPEIPLEWSGAIGTFISTILGKLIGSFGAFLIFVSLIVLVLIFGTNIKWKPIIDNVIKASIVVKEYSIRAFKFLFIKVRDFEAVNRELLTDKPAKRKTEQSPDESSQDETLPISDEAPNIVKPIQEREPVIKTSSSQQARIIRSSFKPNLGEAINTQKSDEASISENNEDQVASTKPAKPLNIRIDKSSEDEMIFGQPLGLRQNIDEEKFAISTRSGYLAQDSNEDEFLEPYSDESDSWEETKVNDLPDELLVDGDENNDDDEQIPEIEDELETETQLYNDKIKNSDDYFPVDEPEEQFDIDEALIISKPVAVQPPPAKPFLPPQPIRIPAIPSAQPPNANRSPLVLHLEEVEPEEAPALNTPLGVAIHDEEIDYDPPMKNLLDNRLEEGKVSDDELTNNARVLQEKLATFNIIIEDLTVTPGPVVTQYEFVPAAGIKISRIENLSDDLAMALKAKGIRIIAPIPGKGTVGIEIPNMNPSIVRFSHVVNTSKFYESPARLPLALGKTISGEVLVTDLTKAPHLMIAGSTGSGKSVGINTIISSLLYRMKPSDLKFVIIDPKKVELQQYSRLRHHFLAISPDIEDSIVTNPADAVSVLKSVVLEMENRYDILARVGQRNIADYNDKVRAGVYDSIKDFAHRPMPYIVVVIDELADLMLTASKEVEEPIIRLAQMARAIGIHLIVATQRPSVNVITGIIKANFPARLAYLVASKVDSRTILDISGAEQLLGNGDMLFLPGGSPKPVRIQNAFISTDEVENICNFIGKQDGYSQPYMLPSIQEDKAEGGNLSADERDALFEDSARLVIQHQQASVSLIQRRMKVGYARAGRIIDELEDAGIVGPNEGSKARLVLYESESDLERIL